MMQSRLGKYKLIIVAIFIATIIFILVRKKVIINITNSLPRHPTKRYSRRDINRIDDIIIHHTATPENTTIRSIANYHTNPGNHICEAGCPGIAYHFMIKSDGSAYQVNELETISYQCGGCNSDSVGIALIGDFSQKKPTKEAIKATKRVIRHIRKKVGKKVAVSAHRDHKYTNCPGEKFDISILARA